MGSPILQDEGRVALAKALAAQDAYIAWGRGDGAWADQPTPSTRTTLIDEIGRRKVTAARFVTVATAEDSQVVMPGNKHYKFSEAPTNLLHLSTTFDFAEGAGETVRECALFFGTTAKTGVPAGQRYLLPSEVGEPGFMYLLEFRPPWPRTGSTQGFEQFILPF
jgi:hypothetical protein